MATYRAILQQVETWGPYMTDYIGKCQREIIAFNGNGNSRIDKYFLESATYAAAKAKRDLKGEFVAPRAERGVLRWKEGRTNGVTTEAAVEVDEEAGVVREQGKEKYGFLVDVRGCLHRKSADGKLIPWK